MSIYRDSAARGAFSASLKLGVATAALCVSGAAFAENGSDAADTTAEASEQQANAPQANAPQPVSSQSTPASGGEIVVSGIRASLEDALEIRRNADVVLDGISADDIGSTPDLNLGEALARIPGVQINREGARRDATISVRGLPGQFTKTTVMGQTIASTTRGANVGNPFGIFDSSIFNGANVIKSFTGDTPSGGLAAVVDLRITSALQRRDSIVVRGEVDYEETTGDYVPKGFFSISRRLSDRLGVYGTLAYSEQSFRRDSLRVNNYSQFSTAQVAAFASGAAVSAVGDDQAALAANSGNPNPAFNIPTVGENGLENAVIYPSALRQITQNNRGDRISGAAGFAYEITPDLELRVDGIYTRRDLTDTNQDIIIVQATGNSLVSPLSDPVNVGAVDLNENGTEVNAYLVPRVLVSDQQTPIGNRRNPGFDKSWAIYPQLHFENDDWRANLTGAYTKAVGYGQLSQYDLRIRERAGRLDSNLDGIDDRGNGGIFIFDQGLGNLADFFVSNTIDPVQLDFNNYAGNWAIESGSAIGARDNVSLTPPGPNQNAANFPASVLALGFDDGVRRDLKSLDFELARKFSGNAITEVSLGGYYSKEKSFRYRYEFGGLGLNYPAITSDILKPNDAVREGATFVGGNIAGLADDQFLSINIAAIEAALGNASRDPVPGLTFNPSAANKRGYFPDLTDASAASITAAEILAAFPLVETQSSTYLARANIVRQEVLDNNFSSDRETVEFYWMGKFDLGEVSDLQLRGNAGVRYVHTDLNGIVNPIWLQVYDNINAIRAENGGTPLEFRPGDNIAFSQGSNTFSAILPSVNLIYEITPNLVARAAYYETFEAMDLAEFTPTPTLVRESDPGEEIGDSNDPGGIVGADGQQIPRTTVSISTLEVEPRRSRGFDLGLSWYNRPGSVISLGFFRKSLIGDITRQRNFCPDGETLTVDGRTFRDIRFADPNSTNPIEAFYAPNCVFTNDLGDPQRIRVSRTVNNPDTINVTGWEAQIQQNFDFLPGLLGNTGMVLNYTRVRSGGDNDVQLYNVAEDTYNIIGYYEDSLFEARIAYNHQSEIQRQGGSSFTGGSTIIAPRGQLDFSGAIKPMKGLQVRFEVFNITQSSRREYLGVEELFRLYEYDGRTYSLSASYRF